MRNALLFLFTFLASASAFAQSEDAISVLTFGGVQTVQNRDLIDDGNGFTVTSLGAMRIVPTGEDFRVGDLKILEDGSPFIADANGRGAAVYDRSEDNFRYVLDPTLRSRGVKTASVANYFSPGQPSNVLLGDSASGFAVIREATTNRVLWFEQFHLANAAADIVQAAVTPQNEVVVAINWADIGTSAIGIYTVSQIVTEPIQLLNRTYVGAPIGAIIVPEITSLRDLMVLADGTFLVTTRSLVFNITRDGTILWRFSIGDDPAVGGEFSSGRQLRSGRIAVTTYQPGDWVTPSFNHRAHWLDPETQTILATTGVFNAAPIRVEPTLGHGGTGTFGFTAGLDDVAMGEISSLQLDAFTLTPVSVVRGDRLDAILVVSNAGAFGVAAKEISIRANPGECDESTPTVLSFSTNIVVSPMTPYTLQDTPLITSDFSLGQWCAFVEVVGTDNARLAIGDPITFTIIAETGDTNSIIDTDKLPFGTDPPVDVGVDGDAGDAGVPTPSGGDGGCCATSGPTTPTTLWLILVVLLLLAFRFQIQATRERITDVIVVRIGNDPE